jgi:abhydrolase domain-containing protein 6
MKKRWGILMIISIFIISGIGIVKNPEVLIHGLYFVNRTLAGVEEKTIQINQHKWHYLEGGKGETIVFLHGFGGRKDDWRTMYRKFSSNYHLIIPDIPGFNESSYHSSSNYSISSQAKRLQLFLDKLKIKKVHLVGLSMGGGIASYFASEYPTRIQSLFLIDALGIKSKTRSKFVRLLEDQKKMSLIPRNTKEFDEMLSLVFYKKPKMPDFFKDYLVQKAIKKADKNQKIFQDLKNVSDDTIEKRLPKIQAKTLILWGKEDQIFHVSSAYLFQKKIQRSQVVVFDRSGHVPVIEFPDKTNQVYQKFLQKL